MKTTLTIFLLLLAISTFSQKSIVLKTYMNADYQVFDGQGFLQRTHGNGFQAGRLTFAVNQQLNKSFYHDLELSHLSLNRERFDDVFSLTNTFTRSFDLGLRYELGYRFISDSKLNFSFGLGAKPRYTFTNRDGSIDPIEKYDDFTLTFSAMPRASYNLNKSLQLEFSPVLNIFELYHSHERQSGRDMGDNTWTPAAIGFRIGLGYRFGIE